MKFRFTIVNINYASVILVKCYSKSNTSIKLGISLSKKEDNRLGLFDTLPDDIDSYNIIVQTVVNNICRGKKIGKISKLATNKECAILLKLCKFSKDEFVNLFICDND